MIADLLLLVLALLALLCVADLHRELETLRRRHEALLLGVGALQRKTARLAGEPVPRTAAEALAEVLRAPTS